MNIDYAQTGFFSKTLIDYLNDKPALRSFYKYRPEIESFREIIADRKTTAIDRKVLTEVLQEQYKGLGRGLWTEQIAALANENCFTVTTGHQLCLATGPLYFIYKIITTINLAAKVEAANPGTKVVPIYWMATEDHDFEEINHFNLFNKKQTWSLDAKGATGRLSTETLKSLMDELKPILGESESAKAMAELLERCYLGQKTFAAATRAFVHELFGRYGLVIIDADDALLKTLFAPIMQSDITEQHSYRLISETIAGLEKVGAAVQVNPREINFFYLEAGLRERIIFENDRYKVLKTDISFDKAELLKAIDNHPERFSPNVVMRPLYQEVILPNLAYIGGGAEVGYWMEFKSTFEHYHVNFPLLLIRNSALMIDQTSLKRLDQLNLRPENLFEDTNRLVNDFVKQQSCHELNFDAETLKMEKAFVQIALKAQNIDPTLVGAVEAEKTKFFNSLKGLESRLAKAEKKKFETQTAQIIKLKEKLFPNGSLQERTENFIPIYLKQGQAFIEHLLETFDPMDQRFSILNESGIQPSKFNN